MYFPKFKKLSSFFIQVLILSAVNSFEIIEDTKEIIRSCPEEAAINPQLQHDELYKSKSATIDLESPDQVFQPKMTVVKNYKPTVNFLNVDDEELKLSGMPSGETPLDQGSSSSSLLMKNWGKAADANNVSENMPAEMILIEWANPEPITCKKLKIYTSHSSDACIAKRINKMQRSTKQVELSRKWILPKV